MTISLVDFLSQLTSSPVLAITVLLTLGVILVNGWTGTGRGTRPRWPRAPRPSAAAGSSSGNSGPAPPKGKPRPQAIGTYTDVYQLQLQLHLQLHLQRILNSIPNRQ